MTTISNEFTCSACGNTYEKDWSDEEAKAEYEAKFDEDEKSDPIEVVCDDCYRRMFPGDNNE